MRRSYLITINSTAEYDLLDASHYARARVRLDDGASCRHIVTDEMSMFSRRAIGCLGRSLADRFCERLPSQLANELCEIVKVLEASK